MAFVTIQLITLFKLLSKEGPLSSEENFSKSQNSANLKKLTLSAEAGDTFYFNIGSLDTFYLNLKILTLSIDTKDVPDSIHNFSVPSAEAKYTTYSKLKYLTPFVETKEAFGTNIKSLINSTEIAELFLLKNPLRTGELSSLHSLFKIPFTQKERIFLLDILIKHTSSINIEETLLSSDKYLTMILNLNLDHCRFLTMLYFRENLTFNNDRYVVSSLSLPEGLSYMVFSSVLGFKNNLKL